jgi:hypothetical protein
LVAALLVLVVLAGFASVGFIGYDLGPAFTGQVGLPRANGDRLAVAFLIGLRPADDPRRGPQDELCAAAGIARQLEKSS